MPRTRKQNLRKANPRILILCEGEKTEPNYFNRLKADRRYTGLSSIDVVVVDVQVNTAKELVKEAIKRDKKAKKDGNPFLETWIVIDKDGYTKHPEAFDHAKVKDVCIAFSSICFEYWLLLHFKYTTKAFDKCDTLISHLRELLPEYEKRRDIYDLVKDKTEQAIAHANMLMKDRQEWAQLEKPFELNPYTNIDILVTRLLRINELKDHQGNFLKLPGPDMFFCTDVLSYAT